MATFYKQFSSRGITENYDLIRHLISIIDSLLVKKIVFCWHARKYTWNRWKLPRITVQVLSIFRACLVDFFVFVSLFFLRLENKKLTLLNKWIISSSKSLSSSDKIEILSKSSKDTNGVSLCGHPEAMFTV